MAKCQICNSRKAKRYCSALAYTICTICCAESRLKTIDCPPDCRFLKGEVYQKKRNDEKEFVKLMHEVPHGQFDDIFHDDKVALVAYDIELRIVEKYKAEGKSFNDNQVYEAYRKMYKYYTNQLSDEEFKSNAIAQLLLNLSKEKMDSWNSNLSKEKIAQIFIRLMITIDNISGGITGEYGYLNYLKNNLGVVFNSAQVIVEDKFNNKSLHDISNLLD